MLGRECFFLIFTKNLNFFFLLVQDYLNQATSKYAYTFDQALGLLYFNNYDIKQSIIDMSIYLPSPNEWTDEDKILFEHAYMFHGKNFNKIRQVVSFFYAKSLSFIGFLYFFLYLAAG